MNSDHPFAPLSALYSIGNVIEDTCNATDVVLPSRPYLEYWEHLSWQKSEDVLFEALPELWRFSGRRFGTEFKERFVLHRSVKGMEREGTAGFCLPTVLPYPPKHAKSEIRHFAALEIRSVPSFMCFVTQEFESLEAMDHYLNIDPRGRGTT